MGRVEQLSATGGAGGQVELLSYSAGTGRGSATGWITAVGLTTIGVLQALFGLALVCIFALSVRNVLRPWSSPDVRRWEIAMVLCTGLAGVGQTAGGALLLMRRWSRPGVVRPALQHRATASLAPLFLFGIALAIRGVQSPDANILAPFALQVGIGTSAAAAALALVSLGAARLLRPAAA